MRAHFLAVVLLVVVLAVSRETAATQEGGTAADPFMLAVLRQDSVIVPFIAWDGRKFVNTWVPAAREIDTPITFDAIPKRWWNKLPPVVTWHAWQVDSSRTEIQATAPVVVPVHCQQNVGLRTTLPVPSRVAPPRVQPYPKIGLAASRPLPFQPIAVMNPEHETGKKLVAAIEAEVQKEEDLEAKFLLATGWRHPVDEPSRHQVKLQVEGLYRAATTGNRFVYYFEAVKRYEDRSPRCAATFVSGWFTTGLTDAVIDHLGHTTKITACDYSQVNVMLPLAHFKLLERSIWVVQLSGWDREMYALIDPLRPRLERQLAGVAGGSCERD